MAGTERQIQEIQKLQGFYFGPQDLYGVNPVVEMIKPAAEMVADARFSYSNAERQKEAWTLPGTGFTVSLQFEELLGALENKAEVLSPSAYQEVIENWSRKARENMLGFYYEYLSDSIVYPITVYLERGKLVCPHYENKRLVDTVNKQERKGATLHAVQTVESQLVNAPAGSYVFYTSSPGESGLQSSEGKKIIYKNSQTYMFMKGQDGSVAACTLQSNMDLVQNEKLLKQFGFTFPSLYETLTDNEKLEFITAQVVSGKFESGNDPFKTIFNTIGNLVEGEKVGKNTTLAEALVQLQKLYEGTLDSSVPPEVICILDKCLERITVVPVGESLTLYAQIIGETVLALAALHTAVVTTSFSHMDVNSFGNAYWQSVQTKQNSLQFLQTRAGCNGGGIDSSISGMTTTINFSDVPRIGFAGLENTSSERILCCTCPFCEKQVDAKISNGKIHCPNCNKSAEWKD